MEMMMKMKKYEIAELSDGEKVVWDTETNEHFNFESAVACLNEQQITITALKEDKAIAEDYANIFEKENVKLRKKLNNYKATVLGFIWMMEQNGRISGKDDKVVKDLFKLIE